MARPTWVIGWMLDFHYRTRDLTLVSLEAALEPYRPQPIDTSAIDLSALEPLMEALARNAHEVWARQRMQDGWSWGPARDDARKQHPSLVPFEELPDSEKAYDSAMVTETLKTVLALGYKIVRG
jgi:adenylate cyclase